MKKNIFALVVILILAFFAYRNLLQPGYFSMHDDLQVMRIFQMEKCFDDGQIPCRWSPDMAYGYGQPMFNYYSAFPYYLGVFLKKLLSISMIGTVKLLFFIGLIGSGYGMYVLVKEIWGKVAGIFASLLYIYSPYHALDIYVRGALSEVFSLAILPFLWHALYLLIIKPSGKNFLYLAITLVLLLTTHNISTLIYVPFSIFWITFWLIEKRKWKSLKDLVLAGLFGFFLAAFFILPLLFEKKLIQTEFLTTDYLNYLAHFATIKQLFMDRSWGYGPSIFGPEDNLSFQIGWPHWWLVILEGLLLIKWLLCKKRRSDGLILSLLLFLAGLSVFLVHSRSTFLWQYLPAIEFVQFPWRFLGLVSFFLSFAAASLVRSGKVFRWLFLFVFISTTIILNAGYFKPERLYKDLTDSYKLSGEDFIIQQKSAILDYLPKTAKEAPKSLAPANPEIISGEGRAYNYSKKSNSFFTDIEVYSNEAEIQIPIIHFPGWVVIKSGKSLSSYPSGDYGQITVKLPEGKHIIQGRFENTPIRSLGNALTLISASILFVAVILKQNGKKFLWY